MSLDEIAAATIARVRSDPLYIRYLLKVRRGHQRDTSVLDFLGDQRMTAVGMLTGIYGFETERVESAATQDFFLKGLGVSLLSYPSFIWTDEMFALASSYDLPPGLIVGDKLFPHQAMWWSFPQPRHAMEPTDHAAFVCAYVIVRRKSFLDSIIALDTADPPSYPTENGWNMFEVCVTEDYKRWPPFVHMAGITDGEPVDRKDEGTLNVIKMSAFLNSHFVDISRKKASDVSKRWRGRRIGDPSSINVITLRSSVRDAVRTERGEGPEWHQRWLVRGHLRAQYYPSTKSHSVIWIAPYIKGPEWAPLKAPIYHVSR